MHAKRYFQNLYRENKLDSFYPLHDGKCLGLPDGIVRLEEIREVTVEIDSPGVIPANCSVAIAFGRLFESVRVHGRQYVDPRIVHERRDVTVHGLVAYEEILDQM